MFYEVKHKKQKEPIVTTLAVTTGFIAEPSQFLTLRQAKQYEDSNVTQQVSTV